MSVGSFAIQFSDACDALSEAAHAASEASDRHSEAQASVFKIARKIVHDYCRDKHPIWAVTTRSNVSGSHGMRFMFETHYFVSDKNASEHAKRASSPPSVVEVDGEKDIFGSDDEYTDIACKIIAFHKLGMLTSCT